MNTLNDLLVEQASNRAANLANVVLTTCVEDEGESYTVDGNGDIIAYNPSAPPEETSSDLESEYLIPPPSTTYGPFIGVEEAYSNLKIDWHDRNKIAFLLHSAELMSDLLKCIREMFGDSVDLWDVVSHVQRRGPD